MSRNPSGPFGPTGSPFTVRVLGEAIDLATLHFLVLGDACLGEDPLLCNPGLLDQLACGDLGLLESAVEVAVAVVELQGVRDVALELMQDSRIGRFTVEAENFESIHNHSAYARLAGRGKLVS